MAWSGLYCLFALMVIVSVWRTLRAQNSSALDLSFKKADSVGAVYILANDPDADRLGVAQKDGGKWRILTGNEIGALLGWWLIHTYK